MGNSHDHIKKYDPGKYERCLKISERLKKKFLTLLDDGKAVMLYMISSSWHSSQPSVNNILRLWKEGEKILYIRDRKTSVVINPSASIFNQKSEERWGEFSGEVHEITMFEYPQHEVVNIQLFDHGFSETENGVKIPSRFDFHLAEAFRFKKDSFYKMKCFPDKESMNLYYEIMKGELS